MDLTYASKCLQNGISLPRLHVVFFALPLVFFRRRDFVGAEGRQPPPVVKKKPDSRASEAPETSRNDIMPKNDLILKLHLWDFLQAWCITL